MMRSMSRAFGAVVLSGLLATSAVAAGPLPAGKPAGVQEVALRGPGLIVLGAIAIIAVTVAVVSSDNDGTTGTVTTGTGGAP